MPSSAELVATLQAAGVQFGLHSHGAVMTVEAQETALAGNPGTVLKNLFIKDKKNRLYIITAMPQTTVDLNSISMRLGVGKGALRFAPDELLQEVLQVPLGSVTPLAVSQPSARDVVLFLDARIQQQPEGSVFFIHPLVNTQSLALTAPALDAALRAVGREPLYVDLEARCDAKNPDLAKHTVEPPAKQTQPPAADGQPAAGAAPAKGPSTPEPSVASAPGSAAPGAGAAPAPNVKKAAGAGGKGGKAGSAQAGGKAGSGAKGEVSAHESMVASSSVLHATQRVLDLVAQALSSSSGPAVGSDGLAARLDDYTLRRLTADLESQLGSVKNAAYALGYQAGKGEVVAYAQKRFA